MSYNISTGIFENEFELNTLITNNANSIELIEIVNNEQQVLIDNSVSDILDIETCNVNQQVLITTLQTEINDIKTCNVNQQVLIDSFDSDLTDILNCNVQQQNEIDTLQAGVINIETCNVQQQNEIDTLTTNLATINYDIDSLTTDDIGEGTNNLYSQWETSGTKIYYNSGNVGIGTNSPNANLHIYNTGNPHLLIEDGYLDNQVRIEFKSTNYNYVFGLHGGVNLMKLSLGNTIGTNDLMIIDNVGNFDVVGDINIPDGKKYKIDGTLLILMTF